MDAVLHSRYRELLLLVADTRRWTILRLLGGGGLTVTELVDRLDIEQPAVSHHLGRLRRAGLVSCNPKGRTRRYTWAASPPGTPEWELQRLLRDWLEPASSVPPGRPAPKAAARADTSLDIHLL